MKQKLNTMSWYRCLIQTRYPERKFKYEPHGSGLVKPVGIKHEPTALNLKEYILMVILDN